MNIDLSSSEMLENQLLNLNMYATTMMNESTAAKLSADRRAKFTNNASIESTNSGSGAGGGGGGGGPGSTTGSGIKRRQLPQIPGMIIAADKQSRDKGGMN